MPGAVDPLAVAAAEWHFQQNPFFRQRVGTLPNSWEDWPIWSKADYQMTPLADRLTPKYRLSDCHVGQSSGSTGHPLHFAKDKYAHALTWTANALRYQNLGVDLYRDRQARFFGGSHRAWAHWKAQLKNAVMRRHCFSVMDLSDATLAEYVQHLQRGNFTYVYGYANALLRLAHFLQARQQTLQQLCPKLRLAISTSELLLSNDQDFMAEVFGFPVFQEYGISEIDVLAMQNEQGQWVVNAETCFVEITDAQGHRLPDGQVGQVVVTALYNHAHPFVRYNTGDIGAVHFEPELGRYILTQLEGRQNDQVHLPSGKICAGNTCVYITKALSEAFPTLQQLQYHGYGHGRFDIHYVAAQPLTAAQCQSAQRIVEAYLEPNLHVRWLQCSQLEAATSGKRRLFIQHDIAD